MTSRRRAYTLTEVLVIITILVVMASLSARPLRILLSEIPRSARTYQIQKTTADALKQIKQDIERSTRIFHLKNGVLTLEHNAKPVAYTLMDGRIIRRPALNNDDEADEWNLSNVKIQPRLWRRDNEFHAVELTVWTRQKVLGGKDEDCFRQTMVFFQKDAPK